MHRPIPTRAHDLRQSLRIILIGLVDLHLECSPRMPGVKASDVEPAATQFVYQPWRHRTGFDTDTGILSGVPTHRPLNLFRVRRALAPPQPATDAVNDADRTPPWSAAGRRRWFAIPLAPSGCCRLAMQ
jgi:hypothetical protein